MTLATVSDIGKLVRVKLLDGSVYLGRLLYLDDDWFDVSACDDPRNSRHTFGPADEVEEITLVAT